MTTKIPDSTQSPAPEPDALAVTRQFVRKVDGDPKLQRAIQKAVKQMKEQPGGPKAP